jgi:hypothetical protein
MKSTDPFGIQVGTTRQLKDFPLAEKLADIDPDEQFPVERAVVFVAAGHKNDALPVWRQSARELLFMKFITELTVAEKFGPSVDSLPLLHGTLALLYGLRRKSDFFLDIGEGWGVAGKAIGPARDTFALQVGFHTGLDQPPAFETTMNKSQLLLALACLATDLAASISAAGFPAWESLSKFPVDLSKD